MHLIRHPWIRLIGRIFGIIFLIYLVFSLVDIYRKREVLKVYEDSYLKAKAENERLKKAFEEAQTPEFIERLARDKLSLVREGETIVLLDTSQILAQKDFPSQTESGLGSAGQTSTLYEKLPKTENLNEPKWKAWWRVFF